MQTNTPVLSIPPQIMAHIFASKMCQFGQYAHIRWVLFLMCPPLSKGFPSVCTPNSPSCLIKFSSLGKNPLDRISSNKYVGMVHISQRMCANMPMPAIRWVWVPFFTCPIQWFGFHTEAPSSLSCSIS